jgi:hypothetical protein
MGQAGKQPDRLGEILCLGLVEIEDQRHEAKFAEFSSQPLEDFDTPIGEATQQENTFFPNGVDHVADL